MSDVNIVWLVGDEKLYGKVGEDEGDGLALRKDGEEILFAPIGKTLKWVSITEFSTIEENEEEDEQDAAGAGAEAPAPTPFPRRRRG